MKANFSHIPKAEQEDFLLSGKLEDYDDLRLLREEKALSINVVARPLEDILAEIAAN